MRKRRINKVKFDGKLIVDVIGASLIVQKAPLLIDKVITLSPEVRAIAGVGAGYVAGMLLKRPELSNAAIGLGVVDFVAPMVDSLFSPGVQTAAPVKTITTASSYPVPVDTYKLAAMGDYINLNDYISNPNNKMQFPDYENSY